MDPDRRLRQILEAWLLTNASFSEIAKRFATDPLTIEYFEQLFFNIRDRMQHKDWIAKIILGPVEYLAPNQRGSSHRRAAGVHLPAIRSSVGARSCSTRLSAESFPPQMPVQPEDVPRWFDDALGQLVRSARQKPPRFWKSTGTMSCNS